MNIGPVELAFVFLNLILICGIPVVVIIAAILFFQRFRNLEDRVKKLEAEEYNPSEHSG